MKAHLTPEERAGIFAKDVIHYTEYAKLRGISPSTASMEICDIRRRLGTKARPATAGYIDIRDYMEHFGYTWDDVQRDYAFDIIRDKLTKLDFSEFDKSEMLFAFQRVVEAFAN